MEETTVHNRIFGINIDEGHNENCLYGDEYETVNMRISICFCCNSVKCKERQPEQ